MKIRLLLLLVITTLLVINISGQQLDAAKANRHYKQAINYYQQKDFKKAADEMKAANQFRPNYPRYLYNWAAILALGNQNEKALKVLNRIASFKIYFDIEKDSDFVSLFKDETFKKIANEFSNSLNPIVNSKAAFSLKQKNLLTESVAFNPNTNKFYVGSVHKRKIVEYDPKTGQHDFIKEGENGIWSVFGMKINPDKNLLYACTGALEQTDSVDSTEYWKSGIFIYDLKTGKLKNKILLDNSSPHLLGDLAIDSKGNVFATDSRANIIYKLNDNKLEKFFESSDFFSLQGITISDDDNSMFVCDYSTGIHRIDMKTREKMVVKYPDDLMVLGIDGLYCYKNSLIGIQNGIRPFRVIKMKLNNSLNEITNWEVLESNNPVFNEPTLGVIVDNNFYFIANSQWESFGKEGPKAELHNPVILKVNLAE